ncbi:hypothetical protein AAFF_G00233230 [Aldrovandia affinis]|uniref:Uncharacterized protein n=1 Tax=Aldrovandia affinis TaxID=143900 RepID=A0AAD7W3J6_9TELE|nr:hypothetical protein AAFF_G00233230 [Aldrovandia affinis]
MFIVGALSDNGNVAGGNGLFCMFPLSAGSCRVSSRKRGAIDSRVSEERDGRARFLTARRYRNASSQRGGAEATAAGTPHVF